MTARIEILAHPEDGRALQIQKALEAKGKKANVRVVDVYTSENPQASSPAFVSSLANPVTQKTGKIPEDFDWALEIGYLPGVTDNIGHTAEELLNLLKAGNDNHVYSSRL
jgi:hypothetical protein